MLKTVLDTLDGLDEPVRAFYAEADDGKFVLQIEGVDDHPDVANLRTAYAAEKAKRQKAVEERDAAKAGLPEDFDLDVWKRAKEGKADPQELVAMRQELEAERDDWKGKFETLNGKLEKRAVRDAVGAALAEHGVPEGARHGAGLHMMDGKTVTMDGETPKIETDMGPMSIADVAARFIAGEGKSYVKDAQGGGAKGGKGDGTGKQSDLVKAVPALADLPEK